MTISLPSDCPQGGRLAAAVWPRIGIVGPLPPPSGGMANQCEQLARLLKAEGAQVELVRSNQPYWPPVVGKVPVFRAVWRLFHFLALLWRALGRVDVLHIFANSGWSWHLVALPAMQLARWRKVAVIVNYRGGQADVFFSYGPRHVLRLLSRATLRVTPSDYLRRVFAKHGLIAQVIPNIIDLSRFGPTDRRRSGIGPHLIVTRNLELIYDISTAIRAFALIRQRLPNALLTVAGTGPERLALEQLVVRLGVKGAVTFSGQIDNKNIVDLYAAADCLLNPSTVDNMPISILEAMASGVPVISTDAGGIPDMVRHGVTALLVPVGDHEAMANQALQLLEDHGMADRLRAAGIAEVQRYGWPNVKPMWQAAYQCASGKGVLPTAISRHCS